MNYSVIHAFIRDFSPKPFNTLENAALAMAAAAAAEANCVGLGLVVCNTGHSAAALAKFRPGVPIVVVSDAVKANMLSSIVKLSLTVMPWPD